MLKQIGLTVLLASSLLANDHLSPLAAKASDQATQRQTPKVVIPAARIAWMKASWTGDDRPYQAMRADIDALAKSRKLTAALIAKYNAEARLKRTDPQAIFRLAYACFQAHLMRPPLDLTYVVSEDNLDFAPFPNTYNYARLKFLSSAEYTPSPELAAAGKRLLQRDPNDYDVEYYLVLSLQPWKSQAAKQEALFYANDLLHKKPDEPSAHSVAGWVYFSTWMVKRDRADGEKAIAAYRDYLRIAPPSYEFWPQAQKRIQYIEQRLSPG